MKKTYRILAFLLAVCLCLLLAACGSTPSAEAGSDDPAATGTGAPDSETLEETLEAKQKEMLEGMLALQQENSDTMGWLYINGTAVDDAVVKVSYNDNNNYYLRRNAKGESDYYGCYYADWRCYTGNRESLSKNTVIYGHSMSEDAEGVKFSQLKKYLKADFAKEHPYICFSTIDEDMVWQIFAVFYTNTSFDYINPNPTSGSFSSLIQKAQDLSFYDYDIEVTPNDKVLTLSTCTYVLADGTKLSYPNNYRFVVMAKLLDADAELAETTEFTVTDNAPVDTEEDEPKAGQEWRDPAIYDNAARIAEHRTTLKLFREQQSA